MRFGLEHHRRRNWLTMSLAVLAVSAFALEAQAQIKSQVVASGLTLPLAVVPDPAFADVLYVVEQGGLVRVLLDGQLQSQPFADFRPLTQAVGERGLLGMAFSPDVPSGRVFFNYTNSAGDTVVSRYRRMAGSPLRVDPSTRLDFRWPTGERVIRQPYANHNGGHLAFGLDGYLYVGLGDGGSANDPENRAQDPTTLLGKMLRLDVRVPDSDPTGYRVPFDNPFIGGQPVVALWEIWAFGYRNPWRYSFDDFGAGATGAMLIGDVGQGAREEINYEPRGAAGRNYGWRIREGRIPTPGVPNTPPAYGPLTDPIFDYGHAEGRAITGGYVYRGQMLGANYRGRYFFADFVRARVWSMGLSIHPTTGEATATDLVEHTDELGNDLAGGVSSFGRDLQGELYLTTFGGRVLKIVADQTSAPHAPEEARGVVAVSTVTVSWRPPSTGPLPSGYRLEAGSAPGLMDLAIVSTSSGQTALTFSGVPPGTYYVRVRSILGASMSAPSNEVRVIVTPGGCVSAPPPPTGFAASVNGRLVTLVWNVPSTESGPTTLVIEAGSGAGLTNLAMLMLDGSLRSLSVQAPPGQYYVRIRGRNACGIGIASNEIVVTVF